MLQNVDFFKTLLNGIKSKFQSQQKQISKHNTRLDDQQAQIEDLKNKKIDAVLYTPQTLTDEQQKQARDNIGADVGGYFEIRVTKSGDTYTADKTYNEIKVAVESGLTPVCRMKRWAANAILDDVFYYYNWQIVDGRPDANAFTFNNMGISVSRYIAIYTSGVVYYFDAMYNYYTLPTATSTTLGGVEPVAKTDVMTQDVGIDKNGKLYTEPTEGGTDLSLGITGATPGQIAKITAVDTNGKPTKWEPVDMAGGGEREWVEIGEVTTTEDTTEKMTMKFTQDVHGNPLSLKGVLIIGKPIFSDTNKHQCLLVCNDSKYGGNANYLLYEQILRNNQTFTVYSEFLRADGINSVAVTAFNSGNVKQNGGCGTSVNTWSPGNDLSLQFPMRGVVFTILDTGLLAGSNFKFWGVNA